MPEAAKKQPDRLGWAALIASLLIPAVGAYVGGIYSSRVKDSENDMKYIEIAISILREEPKAEISALRNWAIDVVAARSIVPLPKEAQDELRDHSVKLGYSLDPKYDPNTPVDYKQLSGTRFTDTVTKNGSASSASSPARTAK